MPTYRDRDAAIATAVRRAHDRWWPVKLTGRGVLDELERMGWTIEPIIPAVTNAQVDAALKERKQ